MNSIVSPDRTDPPPKRWFRLYVGIGLYKGGKMARRRLSPEEVCKELTETGDIIVDPFGGSCVMGVTCPPETGPGIMLIFGT